MQASDFTKREREVLQYAANGMENAEIAAVLGISTNTVRSHMRSMMIRMGTHSRTDAVAKALRQGIVS